MILFLKPKPPYFFKPFLSLFSFDRPYPEVWDGEVWRRALKLKTGKLVPLKVQSVGIKNKPKLKVAIQSRASEGEKQEVRDKLRWIFNTDEDLTELYAFMDKDPTLRSVKRKLYGLRTFRYPTVFEGVIKSIIQQQIALIASMYMTNRLVEKFGDRIKVGEEIFWEFPSPSSLAEASLRQLRSCGLSRGKSNYIKNFSKKVASGEFDVESLKRLTGEEIVEKLMELKGIGRWTAELVVVTSTAREALPADDLGGRRAISNFFFDGNLISGDEARKFTEKWGKFRAMITYYLICAEHLKSD